MLVDALENASIDLEIDGDKSQGDYYFDEIKHMTNRNDWQHQLKAKPQRMDRIMKQADKAMYFNRLNQGMDSVSLQQRKKVIENVYRKKYDIPDDLRVREADRDIRAAVESSEAIQRVENMLQKSIHPSLIFFEHGMDERHISKAVAKLHIEGPG